MQDPQIPANRRIAASDDLEVSTYLEIAQGKDSYQANPTGNTDLPEEGIVIIDFGSQYSRLIARRIRECRVYCEILPHTVDWEKVAAINPKGVILSGGPASVYDPGAPMAPAWVYDKGLPILGICYGMQVLAHQLGGTVASGLKREFGHAILHQNTPNHPLFEGVDPSLPVWMSHGDQIAELPTGFQALAYSENSPIAIMGHPNGILGLQFHPEVVHTPQGTTVLRNFLYNVCGCTGTWTSANFIESSIRKIRRQVGTGRVICALSGGVDSAVTAALVHQAVGGQLSCIFVNNGLLRHEEPERVLKVFQQHLSMDLIYMDVPSRFLTPLQGITDPEEKRRLIGKEFIRIFEEQATKLQKVDFLAQGTLYPDVIESQTPDNPVSAKIKTHHNVGGLPKTMKLSLVEPLRYLFKDEVREVGLALGLPREMVYRQPFPGPGLAIRIIGEVTEAKLEILRACDWIVIGEIKRVKLYPQLWQTFAVLTDTRTVGVQGDQRTYGHVVALRAVTSDDAMTADWARLPYEVLARIANRIVNEVPDITRVVYDITSKPPGTIEWE